MTAARDHVLRLWPWGLGIIAAAALFARFRPLTPARVAQQLGPDPDLVFVFATGPDPADVPCAGAEPPNDEDDGQTATAIAVGWLTRRCERDRIRLELTAEGRRRSAHWLKGGDLARDGGVDESKRTTVWFVTAARFERIGAPVIEATPDWNRKRVIVRGRWIQNADGVALQQAGWTRLRTPAVRDEEFENRFGSWRLIPNTIGRDLSDL